MEEKSKQAETPEEVLDEQRGEEASCEPSEQGEAGGEAEGEEVQEEKESSESSEQAAGEDPVGENVEETDPEAGEPEEAGEEEAPKKERGSFFAKRELKKKDEEIASLKDQLMRARAEFDNFRKRTEKEKAVRFDDGAMFILAKLLPVIDNFERGIAQVPEEAKNDPYVEGLEKIYKQFTGLLEDSGVTPIEAVGQPFDPEVHNAVMHVEDEELGENVVAEEFQKGYRYREQVLRHSMVKVAN